MPLPLAVAVSVFVPSWTVQLPTVATPSTPVVAFAPVTLPPPLDTAKVTGTLGTGKLPASRTRTAGAMLRAYPMSPVWPSRSEEHTSELQSRLHLVCRLLLEKKKTTNI